MTKFSLIKNMLNGSTTMPSGTDMGVPVGANDKVHFHNGIACRRDHSHDAEKNTENEAHNHHNHKNGSCCDHSDDCNQ